eukprot:scaffold669875_cov161-Attheya_sp.AAC.1
MESFETTPEHYAGWGSFPTAHAPRPAFDVSAVSTREDIHIHSISASNKQTNASAQQQQQQQQ